MRWSRHSAEGTIAHHWSSALVKVGVRGLTVMNVDGFGNKKAEREVYRGAEFTPEFVPMGNMRVIVGDDEA